MAAAVPAAPATTNRGDMTEHCCEAAEGGGSATGWDCHGRNRGGDITLDKAGVGGGGCSDS